jgi:hypothetical protein
VTGRDWKGNDVGRYERRALCVRREAIGREYGIGKMLRREGVRWTSETRS